MNRLAGPLLSVLDRTEPAIFLFGYGTAHRIVNFHLTASGLSLIAVSSRAVVMPKHNLRCFLFSLQEEGRRALIKTGELSKPERRKEQPGDDIGRQSASEGPSSSALI